jgi:hypothetical protein
MLFVLYTEACLYLLCSIVPFSCCPRATSFTFEVVVRLSEQVVCLAGITRIIAVLNACSGVFVDWFVL